MPTPLPPPAPRAAARVHDTEPSIERGTGAFRRADLVVFAAGSLCGIAFERDGWTGLVALCSLVLVAALALALTMRRAA
ncbi:MAG TPA: hypothetical protein VH414_04410 [Lichenihabitans sp.]|nr:hypothetical protein [Lichenihabitans sp.]